MIRLSFVEEANLESYAISWYGKSNLSHVDALRDDGWRWGARSDSVGGKGPGLQLRPPNYAPFIRETVFTLPATELQEVSFWAWWESQEGKPYDKLEILGFFFDQNWMHPGWYICSAASYAAKASIDLVSQELYLPGNKIDPTMDAVITSTIKGVTWADGGSIVR